MLGAGGGEGKWNSLIPFTELVETPTREPVGREGPLREGGGWRRGAGPRQPRALWKRLWVLCSTTLIWRGMEEPHSPAPQWETHLQETAEAGASWTWHCHTLLSRTCPLCQDRALGQVQQHNSPAPVQDSACLRASGCCLGGRGRVAVLSVPISCTCIDPETCITPIFAFCVPQYQLFSSLVASPFSGGSHVIWWGKPMATEKNK